MKSLRDFIWEREHNSKECIICEMSLISDKSDKLPNNTQIYVYGENDLQGTKTPHFHVLVDNKFDFMISFNHFHDLEIWRSKTAKHDWKGYKNVKKAIKTWLQKLSYDGITPENIKAILFSWNKQNPSNQVNVDTYINLYKKLKNG